MFHVYLICSCVILFYHVIAGASGQSEGYLSATEDGMTARWVGHSIYATHLGVRFITTGGTAVKDEAFKAWTSGASDVAIVAATYVAVNLQAKLFGNDLFVAHSNKSYCS